MHRRSRRLWAARILKNCARSGRKTGIHLCGISASLHARAPCAAGGPMKIAVAKEIDPSEPRVAASPDSVKKLKALGFDVAVEPGAGVKSGVLDAGFPAASATVAADALKDADIVIKVKRPEASELANYKRGALVIAIMDPYGNDAALKTMADAGVSAFAMELMPRITRAQVMDVLSSQANLAGYRAVIEAAEAFGRAFPMMMTAAGTIPAAKVFVMGVGVAGLQAIATARRLGAVVTATDVRPAVKEQVESLGAKFLAVDDEEFKQAETAGGYAKEMSKEDQGQQAALTAEHIKKQDIIITTALIPGRPAPRLVTSEMVKSMKPGSVLVDLAVERGGNVEGARSGEVADVGGIKIVGYTNVAGRVAASASSLYARNLYSFIETLVDKTTKALDVKWDDELVKATALTRDGAVIHPNFQPKSARTEFFVIPGRVEGANPDSHRKPISGFRVRRAAPSRNDGLTGERHGSYSAGRRSLCVPAVDFRACRVRRLLRGVVGDAGAAYAADVGDQRDLLGDRGRRAARGRRCHGRQRWALGARLRLRRADFCLREHLWWLPGHPAHARDVPEENQMSGVRKNMSSCPATGSRLWRARRQAPAEHPVRRDRSWSHDRFGLLDHPLSRMMTAEGASR